MTSINSGSYNGDNTSNRAIKHGLNTSPKLVQIMRNDGANTFNLLAPSHLVGLKGYSVSNIKSFDANNFYVGDSANNSGFTFYWVAYG
jgi:hypothetical protein